MLPGVAFSAEPAACVGKLGASGSSQVQIESGGALRTFLLRVPPQYKSSEPTPLVFNFHGYTMTAELQETYTGMTETALAAGFILAYPQGIGNSWNAGQTCCGEALLKNVDDVGFARDMVASISEQYCIDPSRVFSTGFSNGGYLSNRLACEASDVFAAVAPASGVIDISICTPPRPVPVMQSQGTVDPLVPYQRSKNTNDYWVEYNKCTGTPSTVYQRGNATCTVYDNCAQGASVEWCEVERMGHAWPIGQTRYGSLDDSDAFWEFFTRHPMGQ